MTPAPGADQHADDTSALAAMRGGDRLRFLFRVVIPTWAQGLLLRKRLTVALAARFDLDGGAVRFLQGLRRRYGEAPLLVGNPGRPQLLLLSAHDVQRVLDAAPEPFTPDSREKHAALSHFEPQVSLISRGPQRAVRRQFHEEVLESNQPIHPLAQFICGVVRDEASRLLGGLQSGGELTWPLFTEAWFRAVRHIVLGERARDDRELTEELSRLRAGANWVFLPVRKRARSRYYARLNGYLAAAEGPGLAEKIARRTPRGSEHSADQVTQWLFAFDGSAITAFRALALFSSHPRQARAATHDLDAWRAGQLDLPYLRAGFFDAVRLWPTTAALLRESTAGTHWGAAMLPKGAGLIIYVPFFHRDDERLADADRFAPESWLGKDPADALPFVPFSAGPAACPGRDVVALIGSFWLAALMTDRRWTLIEPRGFGPERPLPRTFDHFSVRFRSADAIQ